MTPSPREPRQPVGHCRNQPRKPRPVLRPLASGPLRQSASPVDAPQRARM